MPDNDFIIENGVLKKYNGTDINIVIPEGVTEIGSLAFPNKKEIFLLPFPKVLQLLTLLFFRVFQNSKQ